MMKSHAIQFWRVIWRTRPLWKWLAVDVTRRVIVTTSQRISNSRIKISKSMLRKNQPIELVCIDTDRFVRFILLVLFFDTTVHSTHSRLLVSPIICCFTGINFVCNLLGKLCHQFGVNFINLLYLYEKNHCF